MVLCALCSVAEAGSRKVSGRAFRFGSRLSARSRDTGFTSNLCEPFLNVSFNVKGCCLFCLVFDRLRSAVRARDSRISRRFCEDFWSGALECLPDANSHTDSPPAALRGPRFLCRARARAGPPPKGVQRTGRARASPKRVQRTGLLLSTCGLVSV